MFPTTMWGPFALSWFITPSNYIYTYQKPHTFKFDQLSYLRGPTLYQTFVYHIWQIYHTYQQLLAKHSHYSLVNQHNYQYVPHKAVAEVSKIANYRRLVAVNHASQSKPTDGSKSGWRQRSVVAVEVEIVVGVVVVLQ